MHPVVTMKNWSHHLHDRMRSMGHHIDQHLRNRHFWTGIAVALLVAAFATLTLMMALKTPIESFNTIPYSNPYAPYR